MDESPQRSGNINRITFSFLFLLLFKLSPKGLLSTCRIGNGIEYRGWLSRNSRDVNPVGGVATLGDTHQVSSGHPANCENVLLPSRRPLCIPYKLLHLTSAYRDHLNQKANGEAPRSESNLLGVSLCKLFNGLQPNWIHVIRTELYGLDIKRSFTRYLGDPLMTGSQVYENFCRDEHACNLNLFKVYYFLFPWEIFDFISSFSNFYLIFSWEVSSYDKRKLFFKLLFMASDLKFQVEP